MMSQEELTPEAIENILEELATYEIPLADDPTHPELRHKYLHQVLSQCRNYLNRAQFYLEKVRKQERILKLEVKELELDIDFKSKRLLADDSDVRHMPNIKDREALVISKLAVEYDDLSKKKLKLLDIEETEKIIKHKYDHLRGTNGDIKLQRQMVREEIGSGFDEGYTPPKAGRDGSFPNGMPPIATSPKISANDLLDDEHRPEDVPKPVDKVHASQITAFYNRKSQRENTAEEKKPEEKKPEEGEVKSISYSSLLGD